MCEALKHGCPPRSRVQSERRHALMHSAARANTGRRSRRSGRRVACSPGAPSVARERRRGCSSSRAAEARARRRRVAERTAVLSRRVASRDSSDPTKRARSPCAWSGPGDESALCEYCSGSRAARSRGVAPRASDESGASIARRQACSLYSAVRPAGCSAAHGHHSGSWPTRRVRNSRSNSSRRSRSEARRACCNVERDSQPGAVRRDASSDERRRRRSSVARAQRPRGATRGTAADASSTRRSVSPAQRDLAYSARERPKGTVTSWPHT